MEGDRERGRREGEREEGRTVDFGLLSNETHSPAAQCRDT